MKNLKMQRGILKGKLTRFQTYLDKIKPNFNDPENPPSQEVIVELQERFLNSNNLLSEFEEISSNILTEIKDEPDLQYHAEFEDVFFSAISQAKVLLNQVGTDSCNSNKSISPPGSVHSHSSRSSPTPCVRLPTINLPKFNGDIENWLEFREIFTDLIHNNHAITNTQKLHYLKASLSGDAAMTIKSLEFSSNNYQIAWDSLCGRYNNPKILIHNHFKAILDLES